MISGIESALKRAAETCSPPLKAAVKGDTVFTTFSVVPERSTTCTVGLTPEALAKTSSCRPSAFVASVVVPDVNVPKSPAASRTPATEPAIVGLNER